MTIQHAISDEGKKCFACELKKQPADIDPGEAYVIIEHEGKKADACLDCYGKIEQASMEVGQ